MSSTSAVAVLAQGLRELRDFAEGPDGEQLQQRTGLTAEQVEAALGGESLPTREVTLALVEAWEGDVEAWREYWGQIAELAEEDGAGSGKAETPAPPEPSIITPIPEVEPRAGDGEARAEEDEGEAEASAGGAGEVKAGAEAPANAEDARAGEASADDAQAEGAQAGETSAEDASAQESAEADGDTAAGGEPLRDPEARAIVAEQRRAHGASEAEVEAVAAEAEESEGNGATASRPEAEPAARAGSVPAAREPLEPKPRKRSTAARVGVPVLLFAVGVGVGAFGDHALNSKQSATNTGASVPSVSQSSPTQSSPTRSSTSASKPSSPSATSPTAGSSPSTSSTVAPGTVLGTYVGIQLAAGYSVNFLSDPYHPQPGTSNGPDTMGFFADSFVDGRFYAGRVALLDPTDTGSFDSCLNDTRYQTDVLLSQVATNGSFCITTTTGHLVLVTVRRMPSSTDANPYAVLDVTVWQGQPQEQGD